MVILRLCHSGAVSQVINGQRQIMVILRPLSFRSSELSGGRRQIMVIPHTFSPSRGDRVRWCAETNYGHLRLSIQSRSCPMARRDKLWSFCALCQQRGANSAVSGWCWSFGADHFQNFCRFYWRGDLPAEWCFARTKLVSYFYFPFISNKRQVKRGNCHTLISSGDHLFVGMRPSLNHFEVLDAHR